MNDALRRQAKPTFYTVGGTLKPTAPSYITRGADKQLVSAIERGDFCYILTPRQMGKSSLMAKADNEIREKGILSVSIDLTNIGSTKEPQAWYLGHLDRITKSLRLSVPYIEWWQQQSHLSEAQRFSNFLTEIVLKEVIQPVVIFVDEIDCVLSFPFNSDDYFATIRSLYNERAFNPQLQRLTFVLFGVASPSDLIKDIKRTPFNIGTRINLSDFSFEEAKLLVEGLPPDQDLARQLLRRIFDWSGGHPYLTQRLCQAVAERLQEEILQPSDVSKMVDAVVHRIYLSDEGRKTDANLQHINKRVIQTLHFKESLEAYKSIVRGKILYDDELSPILAPLKLSGLVKPTEAGKLIVRNKIYGKVFDENWVLYSLGRSNLPPRFYSRFIERESEMEQINKGFDSDYPVISLEGPQGIGKTTLAIEVGYRCLPSNAKEKSMRKTFDYIIWISGQNKSENRPWLIEVINEVAKIVGDFNILQISSLEDKKKEIDRLLRRKSVLIIIDNYETIEDTRLETWLHQVPPPSQVLITSRRTVRRNISWNVIIKRLDDINALALIRDKIDYEGLEELQEEPDETLLNLVHFSGGNPKAIELSLGHIKSGTICLNELVEALSNEVVPQNIASIFEFLHAKSWEKLTENARNVLKIMPICFGATAINKEALFSTSELSKGEFNDALQQLNDWNLIDILPNRRLIIHSVTREFARAKLSENIHFEEKARTRWISFYLKFVKDKALRKNPDELYWNTLVSDKMEEIDFDWRSIRELLAWCVSHQKDVILLALVLLLVHYMDSRFYNQERIFFVQQAIATCQKLKHKELYEALLNIDALGWTFVEEYDLDKAEKCIVRGYTIARKKLPKGAKADDVIALACAWLARVKIERDQQSKAFRLIAKALRYNSKPWIKSRVYQAAGDIYYKQEKYEEALNYYKDAKNESDKYGGEGHDYRINPRIALAYLSNKNLGEAKKTFMLVKDNPSIYINKLYGEYGLALVEFEEEVSIEAKEKSEKAKQAFEKIQEIQKEVYKRSNSNILLNLINQYQKKFNVY